MELGSIIGLIAGGLAIVFSMLAGAGWDVGMAVEAFVDPPSLIIVFGGTFGAMFIAYPLKNVLLGFKAFTKIFLPGKMDPGASIKEIVELANLARREGILALEERAGSMEDPFLKKGIMLIVDGTDPSLVRSILETEMTYIEARHSNGRGVWGYMASAAPAWGMVGTFIGLILMLLNLDDPDALGPGMATALITTFYGAIVANYLAAPIENKLKFFNAEEIILKEILVEGMLSIQAGENPRIIEEKLKSFLSPTLRALIGEGDGGGGS
ncbi:MAG: motility protein A [Defluviitaleaceae bacterium]|nr:motility protein A [Defluviitaleaceae bacterium]